MLLHLSIRDFALITHTQLTFGNGLTVFVGETGAGKSIIVDALAIAMGARASADLVHAGARKAIVEATFDGSTNSEILSTLRSNDLHWDAPELVVRREIAQNGSTRCFVNDTPTSVAVVRELATLLLDFHGQHDTVGLLSPSRHLPLLDSCFPNPVLAAQMKGAWASLLEQRAAVGALTELAAQAPMLEESALLLRKRLGTPLPTANELESLQNELRNAEWAETILGLTNKVRSLLVDNRDSVHSQLLEVRSALSELCSFDSSLQPLVAEIDSALTLSKEAALAASSVARTDDLDATLIEHKRERVAALQRVAREFGSVQDAINQLELAEQQLLHLTDAQAQLASAIASANEAQSKAAAVAADLHAHRQHAAANLTSFVEKQLATLGIPNAQVVIEFSHSELSASGTDAVEILFSANAGEPPKPLHKIASGGELSRFILSIKSAMADDRRFGTMVFDEIDTGISGRVARQVGEVMRTIGDNTQVICITHLAQIASLASAMIKVTKSEQAHSTNVHAQVLTHDDMHVEVARLISGNQITDAALTGARELMGR